MRAHALQQGIVEHLVGVEGGAGTRDGIGAAARFTFPSGVWFNGNIAYVADNSTIRKIVVSTGEVTTIAGSPQAPQPGRIAYPSLVWGSGSFLYFLDQMVIRRLSIPTGQITTLAGST